MRRCFGGVEAMSRKVVWTGELKKDYKLAMKRHTRNDKVIK